MTCKNYQQNLMQITAALHRVVHILLFVTLSTEDKV